MPAIADNATRKLTNTRTKEERFMSARHITHKMAEQWIL